MDRTGSTSDNYTVNIICVHSGSVRTKPAEKWKICCKDEEKWQQRKYFDSANFVNNNYCVVKFNEHFIRHIPFQGTEMNNCPYWQLK